MPLRSGGIPVKVRDRAALRKRIEKLSAVKRNDSKDLANALLIVNESLQELADRVIALEKVVVMKRPRPR